MNKTQFTEQVWSEYMYWQTQDKKTFKKINQLIADIARNGNLSGEGKPERLSGNLAGLYSRRINEKDRFIYKSIDGNIIEIYSCIGHYDDK